MPSSIVTECDRSVNFINFFEENMCAFFFTENNFGRGSFEESFDTFCVTLFTFNRIMSSASVF